MPNRTKIGTGCIRQKSSNQIRLELFYFYASICKHRRLAVLLSLIPFVFLCLFGYNLASAEEPVQPEMEYVGEFFNLPVSQDNYYFVKSVLMVFGNKIDVQPANAEEEELAVWDQLLLSYAAFRRGITVRREELDDEIVKTLQSEKVEFDWKKDTAAYEEWVKKKTNETVALFENQLSHLLQIEKLRQAVMQAVTPPVSEREAFQEFLNEYNILGLELAEFADKSQALKFYNKAKKNAAFWDAEKLKNVAGFKRTGSVSLEFLMDIWRIPKPAAYKMVRMQPGFIHPPEPVYKGYTVFKVIDTQLADKRQFKNLKNSYYEQVRLRKKYAELGKWFEALKKEANVKVYNKKTPGLREESGAPFLGKEGKNG